MASHWWDFAKTEIVMNMSKMTLEQIEAIDHGSAELDAGLIGLFGFETRWSDATPPALIARCKICHGEGCDKCDNLSGYWAVPAYSQFAEDAMWLARDFFTEHFSITAVRVGGKNLWEAVGTVKDGTPPLYLPEDQTYYAVDRFISTAVVKLILFAQNKIVERRIKDPYSGSDPRR